MASGSDHLKPIKVKDLRIGHYVVLPGSWHTHPFLLSQFKLKSQDQIDRIISMGYATVTYNPLRSDPETVRFDSDHPAAVASHPVGEGNPTTASHGKARQSFDEYQHTLRQAYRTHTAMLNNTKLILEHIAGGREEGVRLANEITTHLAAVLLQERDTSILASLITKDGLEKHALHALNVATLSMMLGRELGMQLEELRLLGMGALLHDLGEQRIPTSVLLKDTPLSVTEQAILQQHPQHGIDLAGQVPSLPQEILTMILHHHEHWDGTGYPHGLEGTAISRFAMILHVVDTFEDLSNPGSPRFICPSEALADIYRKQGVWYPSDVVVALIRSTTVYPPGTVVQLTDGTIALVVSVNRQDRLRPVISLYDQRISSSDPTIIDLGKNPDLSIARSLRLDQVAPEIQLYLNPRRMTGYFLYALQEGKQVQIS
jgi:HD-GYP domain-containing protein (c-di-GMP phosphodiesterase class II)